MRERVELAVIGGGPAGMAAALRAHEEGLENILLIEREQVLGGILMQCIHNGFGLEYFEEELTGPEYAERFIERIKKAEGIRVMTGTTVLAINCKKELKLINSRRGPWTVEAGRLILAMGCREKTRGGLKIPGDRPAGVMTAGTAQRFVNIEGYMPGTDVVVIGSGDVGLIMARRMKLEGARVRGVVELRSYSSGLIRNRVQCLDDFDIPLHLNHTVTAIEGRKRVEKVRLARVEKRELTVIPGSERELPCDTVLIAAGLIPENELTRMLGLELDPRTGGPRVDEDRETEVAGVFACGNVLQVHDLVDYATREAEIAGGAAARFSGGVKPEPARMRELICGRNVGQLVPHRISGRMKEELRLFFRVEHPEQKVRITVREDSGEILYSRPRRMVTPGEMELVRISPDTISGKGPVVVGCEREEQK